MRRIVLALLGLALAAASPARADITVGAVLSLTGPGASLGLPERNALELLPKSVGGQAVRYVVLDDATDTTAAVKAAQKLTSEEHVDLILGPTVTPTSLAVLDVAGATGTPFISLAGSGSIVVPQEGNRRWAFKLAPNEPTMCAYIIRHMQQTGRKTIGTIAQATSFGDAFMDAIRDATGAAGIRIVDSEKYNLTDTSVAPQALKLMSAHPDAIFVAASGTPGALPAIELRGRGYAGPIYYQQGIANQDFLRVGGKAVEGIIFPVSPVLVAEQLPDDNPVKPVAMQFVRAYEGKYGAGARNLFSASLWDSWRLAEQAMPAALARAKPGTPEFRAALRDAMQQVRELVGAQGVFNLSPQDHNGTDLRAQVLVTVRNGTFELLR